MKRNTLHGRKKDVERAGGASAPLTHAAKRRRTIGWLTGFGFALPVVLGVLIFNYYPVIQAFCNTFTNYNALNAKFGKVEFRGLGNYITFFTAPDTLRLFTNTFLFALLSVPFGLIVGYFLALAANFKIKGISVYRMLLYLPVVIPGVASAMLFADIMGGSSTGVINSILHTLGMPEDYNLPFFTQPNTALASLIFMGVWTAGGSMIIWLSAFKNIPPALYEAARLDGGNAWDCLIHITIPMSTPMIFYNLVTGVIGAFQCTTPLVISPNASGSGTPGTGPGDSLYFIAVKIYNVFAGQDKFAAAGEYGYASAIAFVLFAIIGLLTLLLFKTSKWVYYGEDN